MVNWSRLHAFLIGALLVAAPFTNAFAQSTAGQAQIGYLSTSGCPSGSTVCFIQYDATTPLPVTGTFSATLAGFTPNGSVANLSVTTSSGNVALPTGNVVVVTNTGQNDVNFKLSVGAGSAALTDMALKSGAAVGITVGSNTFINAISTGTSSLNIAGGTGLVTGYGGGGSAGSGGGTSSAFGSAFPSNGTAIGFKDSTGTNMAAGNLDASGNLKVLLGSGSTTAVTQATAASLNATVVGTGTFAVQLTGATNNINNISGTVSLPTGAGTAANQTAIQGSKSGGTAATNSVLDGAVYNTSPPTLTNGQQAALQFNSSAQLIVSDPTLQTIANSAVPAGSNIIGKVGIDQSTPGTTNGVQLAAALPAGSNIIGNFRIDQTTPGTTNGVQVNAGSAIIGKVGIDQTTPGTTNAVQPIPGTSGGLSILRKQVANNTTSFAVDASPGQLYGIQAFNNSTTIAYVKLYNAAQGSTTCGSGTPVYQMGIPAPSAGGGGYVSTSDLGLSFGTAITACVTTGFADSDTTAPAANTYVVNFLYK